MNVFMLRCSEAQMFLFVLICSQMFICLDAQMFMFVLLCSQMESMSGDDHIHRLGYDDVNESLSNKVGECVLPQTLL